jgi:hypothetical protein
LLTPPKLLPILLIAAALSLPIPGAGAQGSGQSAFTIGGIEVDEGGKTVEDARRAAYEEAARVAWKQLWSRMSGQPVSAAPSMSDSALSGIVSGIEIQSERFSQNRYIARLGIVFDRGRAGRFLGNSGVMQQSQPMLLLPVLDDAGVQRVYHTHTPWERAWARYQEAASPIDYVRAPGTSGDNVLLTPYQARRGNRDLWRVILDRFGVSDVLTTEARLDRAYPGGPISGTFTARYGPDSRLLERFTLRVAREADLDAMLDQAVRRVDAAYGRALRAGRLEPEPSLAADLAPIESSAPLLVSRPTEGIDILVPTPDSTAVASTEALLRSVPTVTGVSITGLSIGGTSRLRVAYDEGYDWLTYNLDQAGWRLDAAGGGFRLRARRADEPMLPRPLTPEELAARQAAAAAGGVPETPLAPVPSAPGDAAPRSLSDPAKQGGGAPQAGPANLLPDAPGDG